MPQFRMNISVTQKGAIFNAAGSKAAARRMVIEVNEALAQEGVDRVRRRLGQVLQNPTGYYQSKIQVERRQIYRGFSDGGVIYGGWLEGVSSRNRTTRFKGYQTFRIIKQELDFYRTFQIPLPRLHPDERYRRRIAQRNPRKLWDCTCMKCGKTIKTTHAPDRTEVVYCEECYLQAVY